MLNLKLPPQMVQTIVDALAQQPWGRVDAVMQEIRAQLQTQATPTAQHEEPPK